MGEFILMYHSWASIMGVGGCGFFQTLNFLDFYFFYKILNLILINNKI